MTDCGARPPFVARDYFLETAFELRFQGLLRSAWQHRTWHVIAALPGSGKSLGIADITQQSDSYKDTRRGTHLPVLAIRAPKNGGKDLALGMAFCAAFGLVPPTMPWYVRRSWLVQAIADAQVECIVIDDAQDLNLAQLAFLSRKSFRNLTPSGGNFVVVWIPSGLSVWSKGTPRRKCVRFWWLLKISTEVSFPISSLVAGRDPFLPGSRMPQLIQTGASASRWII